MAVEDFDVDAAFLSLANEGLSRGFEVFVVFEFDAFVDLDLFFVADRLFNEAFEEDFAFGGFDAEVEVRFVVVGELEAEFDEAFFLVEHGFDQAGGGEECGVFEFFFLA